MEEVANHKTPLLSMILVNYRGEGLLLDCLASLQRFGNLVDTEIIIVSNGTDPEGKQRILDVFPQVHWIEMGYNSGFARANNRGIDASTAEIVLLLNPDTIALDDSVQQAREKLTRSDFAAAGVQLLDREGVPQISGSFFVKGGLNHLLPIPYWGAFLRWLGYRIQGKAPHVQKAASEEAVDWISGAFLMVKRAAINVAGKMDEDFFLYGEEVEWCSRLRRAGPLCLFGDLRIIHLEGATINRSQGLEEKGYYNLYDRKGLQLMVSNHLRVRKQYGRGWFLFLLLQYSWGALLFFPASFLHDLFGLRNPFRQWPGAGAFAANMVRLWAMAPRILSNKPFFYKLF